MPLRKTPKKKKRAVSKETSKLAPELAPNQEEKFYNIFIPTTPNPTSGYFLILPERDIHVINITRQEAMAMVISGGIIQPEQFQKMKEANKTVSD